MRISDWSSDACSSVLAPGRVQWPPGRGRPRTRHPATIQQMSSWPPPFDAILVNTQACTPLQCNGSGGQIGFELISTECADRHTSVHAPMTFHGAGLHIDVHVARGEAIDIGRSQEHTSALQSLMRTPY